MASWKFAIVSDIHVFADGRVPQHFPTVVQQLSGMGLRLLIVNGDATSGNPGDGHSLDRVRSWWAAFKGALEPLRQAGVPVLPIAGNHDYYTSAHRQGYAEAFKDLLQEVAPLSLSGNPPLYYSTDIDGVHLCLLHVVDQKVEQEVAAFAQQDLAQVPPGSLCLAFGHVPLISIMGHTSQDFKKQLGTILAQGGAAAYFSGHEHLVWDEVLDMGGTPLRQVLLGTASGTYHFPLREDIVSAHCHHDSCTMPNQGYAFSLITGQRQQRHKVAFAVVEVTDGGYQVRQLALDDDGQLVNFSD